MDSVAAVVFDCDGVLLDTGPIWGLAERDVIEARGGRWTPDFRHQANGLSILNVARLLARTLGMSDGSVEDLHEQLVSTFDSLLVLESIEPMAGVRSLLSQLEGQVLLGVASNCPAPLLQRLMEASGLAPSLDVVVGLAAQTPPKPNPDVYVQACQLLEVAPSRCLAFEDSQTGVDAAIAAGLHVTGIAAPGVLTKCPIVPDLGQVAELVRESGVSGFFGAVSGQAAARSGP